MRREAMQRQMKRRSGEHAIGYTEVRRAHQVHRSMYGCHSWCAQQAPDEVIAVSNFLLQRSTATKLPRPRPCKQFGFSVTCAGIQWVHVDNVHCPRLAHSSSVCETEEGKQSERSDKKERAMRGDGKEQRAMCAYRYSIVVRLAPWPRFCWDAVRRV